MALRDHQGLEVSAGTPDSLERYAEAVRLLHGYYGNPLAIVDAALADDPEFLAGHALRAGLMVTTSERRAVPELRRSVEAGEALIARGRGNERERAQIAAARAWLDGDFGRATDRYNRLALEHPRDGLTVQLAHLCNFYLGRSTWLRDHVAAVIPHHDGSSPLYGYLHGMLAFGLGSAASTRARRTRAGSPSTPTRATPGRCTRWRTASRCRGGSTPASRGSSSASRTGRPTTSSPSTTTGTSRSST
jgi:hypothetical protein